MGFKNHVLQLKLSDHFFNDSIFYISLPGIVELQFWTQILLKIFIFDVYEKSKSFELTYTGV